MMDFASNADPTPFPDGLPGPGHGDTGPLAVHDFQSMSDLNTHSDLNYTEIRADVGFRYQVKPNAALFWGVGFYDLDDDAPYLEDYTGEATLLTGGLVWNF